MELCSAEIFSPRVPQFFVFRGKETCQVESIMIVAHSMGGYVARLTPIRHPSTRGLLPNIITLATPHGNPLYAFDETIHRLHTSLYSDYGKEGESLAVSISGGLRDEMIEPKACDPIGREASSNSVRSWSTGWCRIYVCILFTNKTVQYLATTLMSSGHLGMDHRAIVWCHGVLQQVRKVIWRLSLAPADNLQKRERQIEGILGSAIYSEDIADMSRTFVVGRRIMSMLSIDVSGTKWAPSSSPLFFHMIPE